MSYTFFCPTKLISSANAGDDLIKEIGTLKGKVLFLTDTGIIDAGIAEPIIERLKLAGHDVIVFQEIPGNPNVPDVEKALQAIGDTDVEVVVALGGGSVIDTAKAVGLILGHDNLNYEDVQWGRASITDPSIPVFAIPTTAGTGSEMTHVAVIGDSKGFKKGVLHPALFTKAAIIDGNLLKTLPRNLTAATGIDALVHAIEAYLGLRANPTTDLFALAAIKSIVRWLPEAVRDGDNLEARQSMAQASAWAGISFDSAGLGLDHALAGPLCAHYHLHHGLGVAILLPATLWFDAEAIPNQRWVGLRDALNLPSATKTDELQNWAIQFIDNLGIPTKLSDIGFKREDIDAIADEATRMAMIGNNIRKANKQDNIMVLETAL